MSRLALLPRTDGLLGAPDAEYLRLAHAFRAELGPRDLLEGLQVDLALLALALLRRALNALVAAPDDPKAQRRHAQAHRMLSQALREFTRLRKRRLDTPESAPAPTSAAATTPPPPQPQSAPTPPKPEPARPQPRPTAILATPRRPVDLDDLFATAPPVAPSLGITAARLPKVAGRERRATLTG